MPENAAPVTRHSLKNKDLATLTGECSVCGFVAIRKSGNGYQCAVKKAEAHRSWTQRNPEKAASNRQQRSDHQLYNRDYRALTADCSACNREVDLVMFGAGYACGVRARELRSVQQETLAGQWCRECQIIDGYRVRLTADGCPRCNDPRLSDLGASLRDAEHNGNRAADQGVPAGFHVEREGFDAYAMPEYESAVPGWKTLGSDRPWWAGEEG